tara:strand:- start:91969 stop:92556 length:588 start_codon:yes stop_codon:yes gene_type:complete
MDEIFKKLVKYKMSPDSLYVLYCMKNNIVPSTIVNSSLAITRLKSDDWLTEDLQLTSKSVTFVEEINSYFRKSKKKTSKDIMGDDFDVCIKAYNEIFPAKKLGSGKYARTNIKTLEAGFRWFFENYNYDWKVIYEATRKYIEEYKLKNYEYMRTSQYFIRKQSSDKSFESDLATYCDIIQDGSPNEEDIFKEKIV